MCNTCVCALLRSGSGVIKVIVVVTRVTSEYLYTVSQKGSAQQSSSAVLLLQN